MYQVLSSRHLRAVVVAVCIGVLGGCDVAKFTADSTAGLFTRAAPAFEAYWDYELAGEAMPASIVQFEGILRVIPASFSEFTNVLRALRLGSKCFADDVGSTIFAARPVLVQFVV